MKVRHGIPMDFADFDEVDIDLVEALEDFENGVVTYDELRTLAGSDVAEQVFNSLYGEDADLMDWPLEDQ